MRQSLDVSVRGVKLLALAGLLVVGLLLAAAALRTDRTGPADRLDRAGPVQGATPAEQPVLGSRAGACAAQGLATAYGEGPGAVVALVRGGRGVVRAVPFEQGWAVYRGQRRGTLVAVCRDVRPR